MWCFAYLSIWYRESGHPSYALPCATPPLHCLSLRRSGLLHLSVPPLQARLPPPTPLSRAQLFRCPPTDPIYCGRCPSPINTGIHQIATAIMSTSSATSLLTGTPTLPSSSDTSAGVLFLHPYATIAVKSHVTNNKLD